MPISEARRQGLLNLISKNPEKRDYILSRAGATEDDIQPSKSGFLDRYVESLRPPGEMFKDPHLENTAIGQEVTAAGEGFVQGMSAGMVDPRASKPATVDLPFLGESSPSRGVGMAIGGAVSPIVRMASGAGQLITNRLAPSLVKSAVGRTVAGAAGADVTGMGLETVRELATGEKIDPIKIMEVGAMDAAFASLPDIGSGAYSQFKAWLSKVPEPIRNLVERFKSLPEVTKRAQEIANRLKQEHADIGKLPQPEFGIGPERQLRSGRSYDELYPSRVQDSPETAQAAMQAHIEKTINPQTPLLPERTPQTYSKGMGDTPSEIQGFEKAATEKTKQLKHEKAMADKQKFDREIELEYYKKDVEFIKKIEDASRKGEAIPPVVYDEYKKALGRMNQGKGQFESAPLPTSPEPKFPTGDMSPVSIPKTGSYDTSGRAQKLGGLPGTGLGFPTEGLNMSAVGGKKVVKSKSKATTKKK